jgi:uncharacterized protein HemY
MRLATKDYKRPPKWHCIHRVMRRLVKHSLHSKVEAKNYRNSMAAGMLV